MKETLKNRFDAEVQKKSYLKIWFEYVEQIITPQIEAAFESDEKKTLDGYYEHVYAYAKKHKAGSAFCGDDKLAYKLLCEYTGVNSDTPAGQGAAGAVDLDLLDLLG